MENPVREMTLREEIEALNAELVRQKEEMYSVLRNLQEMNDALMKVCDGMCRAVTIQRRIENV